MNFSKTSYAGTVEILATDVFQAVPAKLATPGSGTVVKAGTPINADGESTTGSGAVGILLYDVDTAKNPNGALVVQGIIDAAKAQEHCGLTYVAGLYSALPGVVFRTNIEAQDTGETGET